MLVYHWGMKKTISHKRIRGHDYYYLNYRKNGSVHSTYLGKPDSPKFKRYLLQLISEKDNAPFLLASRLAFKAGVPVAYVENGVLYYEFKNGSKQVVGKKSASFTGGLSLGK
jgi:hypothetical protein